MLVICGGAYMLLLYLGPRKRPESLLNGPTNRSWVERRLDSVTRSCDCSLRSLPSSVFVPAIVEDIALLRSLEHGSGRDSTCHPDCAQTDLLSTVEQPIRKSAARPPGTRPTARKPPISRPLRRRRVTAADVSGCSRKPDTHLTAALAVKA